MTETRVVAKTIIVNPDGKILLLRRSASDVRRPLQWDIPGGHTDGDEFAEEAAVREAHEEAGITFDARRLRLVYTDRGMVEAARNVVWLFFVAHTSDDTVTISKEHAEYCWVTLDEAIASIDYDRQKRAFLYVRDGDLLGDQNA